MARTAGGREPGRLAGDGASLEATVVVGGVAHSTVHAILKRHGRSRAPRTPRQVFKRYEWPCPGDLLHMDIKRYRRFRRPGHPRRLMTDGAWNYTHNRSLHQLLSQAGIRHIVTPPYTPHINGKVERLHQTMDREWARGQLYRTAAPETAP